MTEDLLRDALQDQAVPGGEWNVASLAFRQRRQDTSMVTCELRLAGPESTAVELRILGETVATCGQDLRRRLLSQLHEWLLTPRELRKPVLAIPPAA
jgi:hypothetical protein